MESINLQALDELEDKLKLAMNQEFVMWLPIEDVRFKSYQLGVPQIASYSLPEAWQDYSFLMRKVFCRMDTCIILLKKVLNFQKPMQEQGGAFVTGLYHPEINNLGDKLSYAFEDMVIAFSKLYEDDIVSDIARYLPSKYATEFKKNCPSRNDVNSLYWRVNLLRNRVVHSTSGRYSKNDRHSIRYTSFSSETRGVHYDFNDIVPIKIPCTLIDIENDERLKAFINDVVILKNHGKDFSKKNVFDLLFPEKAPKGYGKKSPHLHNIELISRFDYYSGFLSLSQQMLTFCQSQILIFLKSALSKCDASVFQKTLSRYNMEALAAGHLIKETFSICDVFNIDTLQT